MVSAASAGSPAAITSRPGRHGTHRRVLRRPNRHRLSRTGNQRIDLSPRDLDYLQFSDSLEASLYGGELSRDQLIAQCAQLALRWRAGPPAIAG
ncbi:hypothetical protein ACQP1P_33365 [Dactylosporangium sp. CA-052675]|uniref:hypothetical protein n=1 Tax=Dactylosporangium sp. CA-052675 TaxID=3239927 RepID=UPI003D8A5D28